MMQNATRSEFAVPWLAAPFKLTISVTARCNLACRHCYTDCGAAATPELTTTEWLGFIDQLVKDGFINVFFEGGEPFVREDFEEIAAHAARSMFVTVRTNGTLIDTDRAARLKKMPVGRVYIDMLGAQPETHDGLTGTAGSFDAALSGARALRAAGERVTFLVIFNRRNAGELQELLELARDTGCDEVGVLRLYPLGRAKRNWADLALSIDEMMAVLGALRVPEGLTLMQSWHPNDGNCCWQNAAVDPFGRSIGCPYLREYVDYGNIRTATFRETWNHPLYRMLRAGQVAETCPDCTSTQLTRGGCRSTAYAFTGRWDAADPFCSHLNRGVDLRVLPERSIEQES